MSIIEAADILADKDAYPSALVDTAQFTLANAADTDPL